MLSDNRFQIVLVMAWCLGLVLCATGAAWQGRNNDELILQRLDELSEQVAREITTRMQRYDMGLRGARDAVIGAGGAIGRERFHAYGQSHDLAQEFPGVRGMAFARRVRVQDEAAFVAAARRDGWPQFEIFQIEPHAGDRLVIQYAEPLEANAAAIGLDLASETRRHDAAWRAIRSADVAMTAPIRLINDEMGQIQSVLVMLPVYSQGATPDSVDKRERDVLGLTVARLELSEVLRGVENENSEFALSVLDRSAQGVLTPLYRSIFAEREGQFGTLKSRRLHIFGLDWQLDVRARPALMAHLVPIQPMPLFGLGLGGWTLLLLLLGLRLQSTEQARLLGRQQARMSAIVDSSTDGMIVQTLDGVITDWNPGAERMLGYSASEAVGRTMAELVVPPEYQQQEAELLQKVAQGQATPSIDKMQRTKSGALLPVTMSMVPLRDDKGEVIGLARVVRDISDRKLAEQRVMELNAALTQRVKFQSAELELISARERLLLDNARSSVIVTDAQGRILLFNGAAERLLGYAAHEVVGKAVMQQFHDSEEVHQRARAMSQRLGRPIEPGEIFLPDGGPDDSDNNEWKYVHRNGSRIPVLLTVGALRNEAGELQGFIGIAVDLTERNRLEAKLRHASELAARTEWAEAASAAKTLFLAHISHEIRTPLNAVVALNYLLLRSPLEPAQRDLAHKSRLSCQALLAIVNNVLDLSKIEADEMVLDLQPFDLQQALQQVLAVVDSEAQRKGLVLEQRLPADLPCALRGDALRLRQILINLLSNAIKFTSAGTVTLAVSWAPRDADRMDLRVAVRDTGIGIDEQDQARLFHPYAQAEKSAAWRQGGTGLGLSIAQRLVRLMGGEIGMHSVLNQGSEFWFEISLPLASAAERAQLQAAAPGDDPLLLAGRRLSGVRVLIVDDSSVNQEVARRVLQLEDASVVVADDGQQAVDHLAQHAGEIDVVLMDMQLPRLDGCAATRQIRQQPGQDRLPIIALTAMALHSERERAMQAGMNDFLIKPMDPEALIAMVRRYAGPARALPVAPAPTLVTEPPPDWPRLDGLDRDKSHRHMSGDPQLLRRLLARFVEGHTALLPELQAAAAAPLHEATRTRLLRHIHKLQGSAANLGFEALAARAAALQSAAGTNPASLSPATLTALADDLRQCLAQISAWLEQTSEAGAAPIELGRDQPAPPCGRQDMASLLDMLRGQDFAVIALYARLRPGLQPLLRGDEAERLYKAMQALALDEAIDILRQVQVRQGWAEA